MNTEDVEGLCCDCLHDETGFCGDFSENENCKYKKEDGTCWKSYIENTEAFDKLLRYHQYFGTVSFNKLDKNYFGHVLIPHKMIAYEGKSMIELQKSFKNVICNLLKQK